MEIVMDETLSALVLTMWLVHDPVKILRDLQPSELCTIEGKSRFIYVFFRSRI